MARYGSAVPLWWWPRVQSPADPIRPRKRRGSTGSRIPAAGCRPPDFRPGSQVIASPRRWPLPARSRALHARPVPAGRGPCVLSGRDGPAVAPPGPEPTRSAVTPGGVIPSGATLAAGWLAAGPRSPPTGRHATRAPATAPGETPRPVTGRCATPTPATGRRATRRPATGPGATPTPATGPGATPTPVTGRCVTRRPAIGPCATSTLANVSRVTRRPATAPCATQAHATQAPATRRRAPRGPGARDRALREAGIPEPPVVPDPGPLTDPRSRDWGQLKQGQIEPRQRGPRRGAPGQNGRGPSGPGRDRAGLPAVLPGRALVAVGRTIWRPRDADRAGHGDHRHGRDRGDAPRSRPPARRRHHRRDAGRGPGRPAGGRLPAHPRPGAGLHGGRARRWSAPAAEHRAVPFRARRQRHAVDRGRVRDDGHRHRAGRGRHRHPLADEPARGQSRTVAGPRTGTAAFGQADVTDRVPVGPGYGFMAGTAHAAPAGPRG